MATKSLPTSRKAKRMTFGRHAIGERAVFLEVGSKTEIKSVLMQTTNLLKNRWGTSLKWVQSKSMSVSKVQAASLLNRIIFKRNPKALRLVAGLALVLYFSVEKISMPRGTKPWIKLNKLLTVTTRRNARLTSWIFRFQPKSVAKTMYKNLEAKSRMMNTMPHKILSPKISGLNRKLRTCKTMK